EAEEGRNSVAKAFHLTVANCDLSNARIHMYDLPVSPFKSRLWKNGGQQRIESVHSVGLIDALALERADSQRFCGKNPAQRGGGRRGGKKERRSHGKRTCLAASASEIFEFFL